LSIVSYELSAGGKQTLSLPTRNLRLAAHCRYNLIPEEESAPRSKVPAGRAGTSWETRDLKSQILANLKLQTPDPQHDL